MKLSDQVAANKAAYSSWLVFYDEGTANKVEETLCQIIRNMTVYEIKIETMNCYVQFESI